VEFSTAEFGSLAKTAKGSGMSVENYLRYKVTGKAPNA
jgi:hypothetical protein